jgi:argininosuccinate lyase
MDRKQIQERDGLKFPGTSYVDAVLRPIYDDAKTYLLKSMMDLHRSHLVMLREQGIIDAATAKQIITAVESIDVEAVAASHYDGRYEDLFFYVEDMILQAAGEIAGNLHIARSRNDMGIAMYRIVLREHLLTAIERAVDLHGTLLAVAAEHVETVMLAHTHTQPAQPTTLGHWLTAAADVLARDIARLQAVYADVNRSSMGAAALSTTGFAISRERMAELLGFQGLIENSYDAVAGADYVTGAAAAVQVAALNTGRMVQDLLLWCTAEFGVLKVADPYVQCSSIMPQKRNPVSLEHSRALLSSAAGKAALILQMFHNTPFGDIVDTEDDMQPNLWEALDQIGRVWTLIAAVLGTVEVNKELLLERARGSYANVTELADLLVRRYDLPFRKAHHVVSTLVKLATKQGIADVRKVDLALFETAAEQVLGRRLGLTAAELAEALDPVHFVQVRTVRGGVAPLEVRRMLAVRADAQRQMADWLASTKSALEGAAQGLTAAVKDLLA